MPPMNSPSSIAQNMPNASLMYSTYTPIMGNLSFQIAPSQTGAVNLSNGLLVSPSLEGLIYMQQVQSQTNQINTISTPVTGQNNVQGAITATDAVGNVRVAISGGGGNNSSVGGF